MNCEACGEPLVAGARICGACGKPVGAPPGTTLFCVSCGAALQEGARFCPNCGRGVVAGPAGEAAPAGPAPGPLQAHYGAPAQAPQPAPSAGIAAQYAGFWTRFAARLLDGLIIIAISLIPAIIVGAIAYEAVYPNDQLFVTQEEAGNAFAAGYWAGSAVSAVVGLVYVIIGWAHGRTWGMRALGLRVVRRSTSGKPGFGPAIARYLVSIVSALPLYLGFLWMLWDNAKQTWHDKAANTVVVYER
jgi:uncharacterized RDD family membrane protein YckC